MYLCILTKDFFNFWNIKYHWFECCNQFTHTDLKWIQIIKKQLHKKLQKKKIHERLIVRSQYFCKKFNIACLKIAGIIISPLQYTCTVYYNVKHCQLLTSVTFQKTNNSQWFLRKKWVYLVDKLPFKSHFVGNFDPFLHWPTNFVSIGPSYKFFCIGG